MGLFIPCPAHVLAFKPLSPRRPNRFDCHSVKTLLDRASLSIGSQHLLSIHGPTSPVLTGTAWKYLSIGSYPSAFSARLQAVRTGILLGFEAWAFSFGLFCPIDDLIPPYHWSCEALSFSNHIALRPRSNKEWLNRGNTYYPSRPVISAVPILATNSFSTFLSLISEQLFYYPLLTFLLMKCRKVEMRENAARRISLPITFAAHHFLCADQLPRAGRFHCAD